MSLVKQFTERCNVGLGIGLGDEISVILGRNDYEF